MSRYRIVMRAYPDDYRRQHGDEFVDTANELSSRPWSFRQSRSLLIEGLRTRVLTSLGRSSSEMWASGVALGLALWYLLNAVRSITHLLGASGDFADFGQPPWLSMALALIPLVALTMTTGQLAVLAVSASAVTELTYATTLDGEVMGRYPIAYGFSEVIVVVLLAWWMVSKGNGRRALSPGAALTLLAVAVGASYITSPPSLVPVYLGLFLGLPIVGSLLVAIDQRLLVAAMVPYLRLGVGAVLMAMIVG